MLGPDDGGRRLNTQMNEQMISSKPRTRGRVGQYPEVTIRMLRERKSVQTGGGGTKNPPKSWISRGVLTWRTRDGGEATKVRFSVVVNQSGTPLAAVTTDQGVFSARIVYTPQNFGGCRPWLACPLCGRRAGALFLSGEGFGCRACLRLAYTSQYRCARGFFRRLSHDTGIPAGLLLRQLSAAGRVAIASCFGEPKHGESIPSEGLQGAIS
jgi:hypothetical protein